MADVSLDLQDFASPLAQGLRARFTKLFTDAIGVRPVQAVPAVAGLSRNVGRPQTVAVVGAGLAGFAAAIRLAERGFRVSLLERNPYLGGKVGAWPGELRDGTSVMLEHGFHGFFLQYYNLYALCRDAGVAASDFPLLDDYLILDAEGRHERLARYPRTPPFNLLAMALYSPFLNLRQARRLRSFAAMSDAFLHYHPEDTFARYDAVSFAELGRRIGVSGTGFDALFKVFTHSFFTRAEEVSAAEIAKNFHFYFFANREGLLFRACKKDFAAALWTPLENYLTKLGGRIERRSEVVSLERNPQDGSFTLEVRSPSGERRETADAVVLATDVPGLTQIVAGSGGLVRSYPELGRALDRLPPPRAYGVLRLWGDRDCAAHRASFASLHGHYPLDSISLYHRMQDESRSWARRHGGGVYELHSYTPDDDDARDPERLERMLVEQLRQTYPELRDMQVLDSFRQVRWDFPSFPPGSGERRPPVQTAVPGLYLAGDFVRLPVPAALMEGAVTSGVLAANAIFAGAGVAPEPVWSVPLKGVLHRDHPQRATAPA
jgi:isorenieratene synthase